MPLTPNTSHSTNRRALVLRLSRQALEALEKQPSLPDVAVDLGAKPGLYINGTFFPVNSQTENIRHELYVKLGTQNNLKPFASITGKVTVEPTLDKDLTDQLHQATLAAQNEKNGRGTKFIDTPPTLPGPSKQKKKAAPSSMFMKTNSTRTSDAQPARSQPSASTSAAPAPIDADMLEAARIRLIHLFSSRDTSTIEDAIKAVSPDADVHYKGHLRRIIEEICQLAPTRKTSGAPPYQMKLLAYKSIHPFDMKMSDEARRVIVRAGRRALSTLGFKETDPEWRPYVAPPSPTAEASSSKQSVKDRKKATEPKSKTSTASSKSKGPDASPTKSLATSRRQPPGSGFKLPAKPDDSSSSRVKVERATPDIPRARTSEPASLPRINRLKSSARDSDSERERDKPRRDLLISGAGSLKRKKAAKEEDDDDDQDDEPLSKQKRRKTGDASRPKAVKKELSPAPIPSKRASSYQSPQPRASSSRPSDIRARRRGAAEYTSSEDEEAKPHPIAKRRSPPALPAGMSRHVAKSIPDDPHSQRRYYRKLHSKYLKLHTMMADQQNRVKEMLSDLQDRPSITDDDDDVVLLELEDLDRLKSEWAAHRAELMALRKTLNIK